MLVHRGSKSHLAYVEGVSLQKEAQGYGGPAIALVCSL